MIDIDLYSVMMAIVDICFRHSRKISTMRLFNCHRQLKEKSTISRL